MPKAHSRKPKKMNRSIRKVAVLGSGIMGSRIACHFANIGVEVLLLDIVPREPNDAEKAKGLTTEHPAVRNRIVNEAFQNTLKSNPAALYSPRLRTVSSWGILTIISPKLKITIGLLR
jgi:folate-dependent tRNA-U54 methylase TrmFO/GidA